MAEANGPLTFDFTPYQHQRAAHAIRLAFRFVVLVWHRRAGKTVWAIMELVLAALACTRERGRYGYVCPYLKQAKGVAWDYLKGFALSIPGTVANEVETSVEFPNGAKVRLFGADNADALRGLYFDGIVLDEVADMKPSVWGLIVRPALADREGWAIFIGTPKGVNLFSELYFRALRGEEPGWTADLRRAADTGVLSDAEVEKMKSEMTPSEFAQEVECDFAAAQDDVLLRLDDVLQAQRRVLAPPEFSFAAKVIGVDVARYGDDRTVLAPRQGLAGFKPKVFQNLDTMSVAAQVAHSIDKWKADATFVDQGAMGAGVIDRLLQLGYPVIPVDFGGRPTEPRFENKRAEMWWLMADWVKAGAALPDMPELTKDLTGVTYTYRNARNKLQLESKDSMRERGLRSPDIADAYALTFACPVAPRAAHAGLEREMRVDQGWVPFGDPYSEPEHDDFSNVIGGI